MGRGTRRAILALVIVAATLAVIARACSGVLDPFGSGEFDDLARCQEPVLREMQACRGFDRTFKRCEERYRAEGVPKPEACRAFVASSGADESEDTDDGAAAARDAPDAPDALDASVTASSRLCDPLSPRHWRRVTCASVELPSDLECFECVEPGRKATTSRVQAFSPRCDRAIVLFGCNVDVTRAAR